MFDVRSFFAALRPKPGPPAAELRGAFERAVVAFDAGRPKEALDCLALALVEAATPLATIRNKQGVVLISLGRRDEALTAFCKALAADERHAPALVNLGNILLEDGHAQDAIDYYEAAIRADESYHTAYRNLGVALKALGRRGEAVRALRSAARLESRQRARRA
jgi:tetratricopeptide (TPR) repeat protein